MVRRIYWFFTAAVILSGCGLTGTQVRAVHSFGSATEMMGLLGEEEFVRIRTGIVEMNKELIAIDNKQTSGSLVLDHPASAEATARRVASCKALRSYGELLVQLSGESRAGELASAAEGLMNNTCSALNKELTEEEAGAVSGLISGLGSFWIESKKADALERIIPVYAKPIEDLAGLIGEDFSIDSIALGFLKGYEVTARRLKNAAMQLVNGGDAYSVLERYRAVDAFVLAETALMHADELGRKAVSALKGLKKANNELVQAIRKKSFQQEEIRDFAERIQELVNLIEVLAY